MISGSSIVAGEPTLLVSVDYQYSCTVLLSVLICITQTSSQIRCVPSSLYSKTLLVFATQRHTWVHCVQVSPRRQSLVLSPSSIALSISDCPPDPARHNIKFCMAHMHMKTQNRLTSAINTKWIISSPC